MVSLEGQQSVSNLGHGSLVFVLECFSGGKGCVLRIMFSVVGRGIEDAKLKGPTC
jgi:hypothetical protein